MGAAPVELGPGGQAITSVHQRMTVQALRKEHSDILELTADFGRRELDPYEKDNDASGVFRKDLFHRAGEIGLTAMTAPEEYGGLALPMQAFVLVLEEIAVYSSSFAVTIAVNGLPQTILQQFGSSEQKSRWLGDFAAGEKLGAFCLTEPHCGSDAAALTTTAARNGDSYRLNGTKQFITHGGVADGYMVMARTGGPGAAGVSCFYVEGETPGVLAGRKEDKLGWRTSPTTGMVFEDAEVPTDHLIGAEGDGFRVAMQALDSGRITIAATAVGIARRALAEARIYLKDREAFGRRLAEFQGLQWMLADMDTSVAAARLLVQEAAALKDAGAPYSLQASRAKLFATDTAMQVTTEAVQLLGGYGYTREYPVERLMRDAKATQIVEGTNQIQKNIIAKLILQAGQNLTA